MTLHAICFLVNHTTIYSLIVFEKFSFGIFGIFFSSLKPSTIRLTAGCGNKMAVSATGPHTGYIRSTNLSNFVHYPSLMLDLTSTK